MDPRLQAGLKFKVEKIVSENDTADRFGSGLIPVFATPAMVALMENACLRSVNNFLPEGCMTVGISINIRHIKATPVGMKVECESELTGIDKKKLTFNITAWDEDGQIGTGTHERYIINGDEFMKQFKQ
jgi:fluoroacetyl-CoA thioesterase